MKPIARNPATAALPCCMGAAALALSLVLSSPVQAAKNCTLALIASLPLATMPDGSVAVPVTVAGRQRLFLLGLNAGDSAMTQALATETKAYFKPINALNTVTYLGQRIRTVGQLPEMMIGPSSGREISMLILPKASVSGMSGVLGSDILRNYDVELNLRARKLNLFSPDHCPRQVVYWNRPYARLLLNGNLWEGSYLIMKLDGRNVTVVLDTDDGPGFMEAADARDEMDVSPSSPGLVNVGTKDAPLYRYPFKALTAGAVTVKNPNILIYTDAQRERCRRSCLNLRKLSLGLSVMSKMRLYFAYHEGAVYITAADPAPAQHAAAKPH